MPQCYAASQQMATRLLDEQSNGLFYPSVRRPGYFCLVCFRPALVYSPRRGQRLEITFRANATGYSHHVRPVSS